MNKCPKCGNDVLEEDKFCKNCGAELNVKEVIKEKLNYPFLLCFFGMSVYY